MEDEKKAVFEVDMDQRRGFEHLPGGSSKHIDHPSHAQPGIHVYPDKLYVVTVLENPLRWRSRYRNYWIFENMCKKAGVELYVAEIAFGGRDFEIAEEGNPKHLRLRSHDELLHKENALNLLIQRLPEGAKKIGTLDADIQFARSDWAQEALHLLDHYKVLQGFSHSMDLGPQNQPVQLHEGFVMHELAYPPHNPNKLSKDHRFNRPRPNTDLGYYGGKGKYILWHPGLVWFWRKTAINQLGGLMDWVLGGSADHYMALALFNKLSRTNLNLREFSQGYQRSCFEWQARAERHIRRNIGVLPGLVMHSWHGHKEKRQYLSRAQFLAKTGFDPAHHLKRDWQGLWQLQDDGSLNYIMIRDGLRHFARLRDEDAMDFE
jgi:hypothetical protein